MSYRLISHTLCPYVQRAAIALMEKQVPFERIDIDLGNKPDWFLKLSPLGKVPLLQLGEHVVFESAVICDYLDEVHAPTLHPERPLARAEHRSWVEYASAVLADIAGLYSAADEEAFAAKRESLAGKFHWLEAKLEEGPFFAGEGFSMVDASFGPVFRYFDLFETRLDLRLLDGLPKVAAWRAALAARPSVQRAVKPSYPDDLMAFLARRESHLGGLARARMAGQAAE